MKKRVRHIDPNKRSIYLNTGDKIIVMRIARYLEERGLTHPTSRVTLGKAIHWILHDMDLDELQNVRSNLIGDRTP